MKRALVLLESGREIDDAERALVALEMRFENVGVLGIYRRSDRMFVVGRFNGEFSAVGIEQRPEHGLGVEARQATPHDRAVPAHQCRNLTVADNTEVFESHGTLRWGWA